MIFIRSQTSSSIEIAHHPSDLGKCTILPEILAREQRKPKWPIAFVWGILSASIVFKLCNMESVE